MLSFFIRVAVFLALFFIGVMFGWEFSLSGIIFLLGVGPLRLDYLWLGAIYDMIMPFPLAFFTVIILGLLAAASYLERFFKSGEIAGTFAKTAIVGFIASIIILFFFTESFWPEYRLALKFAGLSSVKIILSLAVFLALFKIIESVYVQKKVFK